MTKELAVFDACREAFRYFPRLEELEAFEHILSGYGYVIRIKTITETLSNVEPRPEDFKRPDADDF